MLRPAASRDVHLQDALPFEAYRGSSCFLSSSELAEPAAHEARQKVLAPAQAVIVTARHNHTAAGIGPCVPLRKLRPKLSRLPVRIDDTPQHVGVYSIPLV